MGVLSDDFATVDLREDYANLSLPKKHKFGGLFQSDDHSEEIAGKK